jgi:hypothetical protein
MSGSFNQNNIGFCNSQPPCKWGMGSERLMRVNERPPVGLARNNAQFPFAQKDSEQNPDAG